MMPRREKPTCIADDFLLAVGTIEPRKNLGALLAFEELVRRGTRQRFALGSWRGAKCGSTGLLARAGMGIKDLVLFTAYVTD